jgi:transcriptional regulator PpsR
MDKILPTQAQEGFRNPESLFAGLGADAIAVLAAAGADLALIMDADSRILDVACSDRSLKGLGIDGWVGRQWADTVTVESREKLADLLLEAQKGPVTRARQVNHPTAARDLPVSYRVVSFAGSTNRIALGQDLRGMAEMQQRLVRAQIEMEKDFRKLRDVESRYRILFHLAQEPLLVLDAQTLRIVDANEGASRLLDRPIKKLVGALVSTSFAKQDQSTAVEALTAIAAKAREDTFAARPATLADQTEIRVTPFREAGRTNLLVRFDADAALPPARQEEQAQLGAIARDLPDAVVLVDGDGRVIDANGAFLDLIRVVSIDRVEGKPLDGWLGGSNVDLQVLMANLREHGSVRRFSSVIRDELGGSETVEISATRSMTARGVVFGFSIREAARTERLPTEAAAGSPQIASQFTELVGRVPLKDLVRDTADIIEKLCIEAALRLTDNNRASAADMLGLSRQSLYIKLRRYGITDGETSIDDDLPESR